jgi:hypothetical protein
VGVKAEERKGEDRQQYIRVVKRDMGERWWDKDTVRSSKFSGALRVHSTLLSRYIQLKSWARTS